MNNSRKKLVIAFIFTAIGTIALIEFLLYPALDTTMSLQGYETLMIVSLAFQIHWIAKAVIE